LIDPLPASILLSPVQVGLRPGRQAVTGVQAMASLLLSDGGRRAMAMVKIPIEIDQEALALAAGVLGTMTTKDTVNAALCEVGQRLLRLRALARLADMADRGDFDEFLGNKAAYRR